MTRGRRPDAGLEPSRQLLTQRAFRQRRAAHLADLEEKISRLERENASLKGIEYVEQSTADSGTTNSKRMKSETSDVIDGGSQVGSWLDTNDNMEMETGGPSSYCRMCALHEKEKRDLMKAVAVVDTALLTLSESMQMLRQNLYQQSEKKVPTTTSSMTFASYNLPAVNIQRQNSSSKHSYSHSSSNSSSEGTSSALASSSSSNTHSVPLPLTVASDPALRKRAHDDDQRSSISAQQTINSTPPTQSQIQQQRSSNAVAAAAASARSAGSANATCNPSSGDCCSKQSQPLLESRPITAVPPQHNHHHQQQQQQLHYHHYTPSQHSHAPLNVSQHHNVHSRVDAAMGLTQLGIDDSKCCLGLFECDSNGNFLAA